MAATQVEDEHAHIRVDPPVIGERTRGRNRSESFAADDDLMISEIDAAVGNDSSATGSQQGSSAPAAPAASSGPKKQGGGQLSRRTLKILNSLEPEGPPGANRRSGPLDDALLAEALLAEEEAAAAASASSGVIRRASVPTTAKTAPEHDMVIKILLLGDGGECFFRPSLGSLDSRISAILSCRYSHPTDSLTTYFTKWLVKYTWLYVCRCWENQFVAAVRRQHVQRQHDADGWVRAVQALLTTQFRKRAAVHMSFFCAEWPSRQKCLRFKASE